MKRFLALFLALMMLLPLASFFILQTSFLNVHILYVLVFQFLSVLFLSTLFRVLLGLFVPILSFY